MAVVGFHFSGIYKEALMSGKKEATILDGNQSFNIGEKVEVYLSPHQNLFEGHDERRIGNATITQVISKTVKNLTKEEALLSGNDSLESTKNVLERFYGSNDDSIITIVKFKLNLY